MKMRDVWISAADWAGVHVVLAENTVAAGEYRDFGVHVMFNDGSHLLLQYSDGENLNDAIEALALRWERLAEELRTLKERGHG